MELRIWENKRKELQPWRRRRPETTVLYRIVAEERYQLEWQWQDRYQEENGFWRTVVGKTLDSYLNCGIPAHGVARFVCEQCGHSEAVAYSCKMRLCPSCGAKRALIFADHLHEEVLAKVPHRHIGFSVPKRIRGFFRRNRKLLDILLTAAAESVREMYLELKPDGQIGLILTIQTFLRLALLAQDNPANEGP